MVDSAVEKHWPHLAELVRLLDALDGRAVNMGGAPGGVASHHDIDAIHEGLLRKKRQTGDLKLT